ncbi:MAG: hypothetical protein AAF394_17590, partial [Planctomycetota bacterium]
REHNFLASDLELAIQAASELADRSPGADIEACQVIEKGGFRLTSTVRIRRAGLARKQRC